MKERVCCLYRVSTDKQVDYNDKNQADIPMQRRKCHQFADQMGWVIVHEEQEDGVSGHKVRAENRDTETPLSQRIMSITSSTTRLLWLPVSSPTRTSSRSLENTRLREARLSG